MYSQFLQNILLPIGDLLFSTKYQYYLRKYRKMFEDPRTDFQQLQKNNLKSILQNAINNSPYYQQFKDLYQDEDVFASLKRFPVLTKDIIRSQTHDLLTIPAEKMIKNSTSGSTGVQTHIFVTKEEQSQYRAIQTLWWEWAGFKMGSPMLQTGLATHRSFEKRLKDLMFRTQYVFAFGLTQNQLTPLIPWINKHQPFLGGYASSLYVISQLLEGKDVKFKSAVSWGDKLFNHYKENIERVLGCKVYETYGTGEGLMIAAQKDLDYMYIMSPFVYVEIVDDRGQEVKDGELGHVIVTSLLHKGMPLIRYKPGDLAIKLPTEKYPEHRSISLPLFQKVIGRETDLIKTPSGKKLIVHSFTGIFEYYSEIKQFCVRQSIIDEIYIDYIRGNDFKPEILFEIKSKILQLLNEPLGIHFSEVEMIPSTPSGKPQIIISSLPND